MIFRCTAPNDFRSTIFLLFPSSRQRLRPEQMSRVNETFFRCFLCLSLAYKITFNTIDNLIWKPQQTIARRSGWWNKIIEPCSGLQFPSIYGNFFSLPSNFLREIVLSLQHNVSCFPFSRERNSSDCLWSLKGRSNKLLLGLCGWTLRINFYLSDKHLNSIGRFIINQLKARLFPNTMHCSLSFIFISPLAAWIQFSLLFYDLWISFFDAFFLYWNATASTRNLNRKSIIFPSGLRLTQADFNRRSID